MRVCASVCACVCNTLIAKSFLSPFSFLHDCISANQNQGTEGMWRSSAQRSSPPHPRNTYLLCIRPGPQCGQLGDTIHLPEASFFTSATEKLQGLDLSSAKKQVGTCEDFRRSYSLQGAMQVCDLDRHSVKGPGVDATYHVPFAEASASVSSYDLNVLSKPVPT